MNRRKAIGRILWTGSAAVAACLGYKWFDWHKKPDILFLDHQKKLLDALVDTIIPPTATPGAAEAGVSDFIIIMVKDCMPVISQNKFINGLQELEAYCHSTFDKGFVDCSTNQRKSVLDHFQKSSIPLSGLEEKIRNKLLEKPFFRTLVDLTAQGYCTSEIGATKGMAYILIPGNYQGCISMQPMQRSWATK